ncbi:MAG: RNA polymerase sigma factor [Bacteroidota bacterium]
MKRLTSEMVVEQEKNLLERLRQPAHREQAFGELVRLHQKSLYYHIRRIVISHDDADDVLQNTFLKAWRNLHNFRADSAIKTWLYRIATNESLTFINRRKKMEQREVKDVENDLRHSLENGPYISGDEIQMKLQRALLTLPDRQKLVFNMRYFDEMKYDEISAVLEVSVGSLKASYHHAAKKIEAYLRNSMDA